MEGEEWRRVYVTAKERGRVNELVTTSVTMTGVVPILTTPASPAWPVKMPHLSEETVAVGGCA